MKKRIFLITLMVALFVCLFAISTSAADMFESDYTDEITKFYDTDGETELLPDWCNLADKDATAVIKKADGTAIRIPLYYIYQANGTSFYGDIRDTSNTSSAGFKYAWISEKLGEEVNHANLVALEIPNGMTGYQNQFGTESTIYSALTELVIPSSITSMHSKMLRDNIVLKKLFIKQVRNDDGTVQGVTSIPDYFADRKDSTNPSALEFFAFELDYCTSVGANALQKTPIKSIKLEGPFTKFSSYAFQACPNLTTVYLKNTSSTIISCGSHAFATSPNLTTVTLDGFSIGEYAMKEIQGTQALTVVATNVGTVGTGAFSASTALVSVDISGPITKLGDHLFGNCTGLLTARIYNESSTPASCGSAIFSERTSLQSIVYHNIEIPWRAFNKIKLSGDDMIITGNYTKIGEEAFYECSNITSFVIPETVTSIGAKAFYKTGIDTITIPGNVTTIGQRAFQFCSNLKSVYFAASNENVTLSSVGSNVFGTDNTQNANTVLEKVIFDKDCNITMFSTYMFYNCDALKYISMPDSVKTIGSTDNGRTFYDCDNLEAVYLSKGLEAGSVFWSNLFVGCDKMYFVNEFFTEEEAAEIVKPRVYYFPNIITSIDSEIFKNCFNLNEVIVFGDKLTSVTNGYTFGRKNASADLGTKNLVFLGDVTELVYNSGNEGAHTNFYIAGKNTTVTSSKSGTCNLYVCIEEETPHLVELHGLSQDANCTENQMVYDKCFCGAKMNKEEVQGTVLGHDYDIMNATSIVYADYTKDGVYTTVCLRCEHDVAETVENSFLFEYLGYSRSNSGYEACVGYRLNNKYIDAYKNLKGESFEYGVLATVVSGDNYAPLSEGYTSSVAKQVLNGYTNLYSVEMIIKGNYEYDTPSNVENYNQHNLSMSLYVNDGGTIKYIWDTDAEDDAGTHDVVTTTNIYTKKTA